MFRRWTFACRIPATANRRSFRPVVDQVYAILAGQTQPEAVELGTAPGEPGRTRGLPHIHINDLAGLLEHLDELPGNRTDIYRLVDDLEIDSDHLLRLTEAAELLGFARIEKGDITLTAWARPLPRRASWRAKRSLPPGSAVCRCFNGCSTLLRASEKQRLQWEVVKTALELEFPPEETERQLDTIVDWGRYAEILAYDDDEETFYLESLQSTV